MTNQIVKGNLINAGNFQVSIGTFDTKDVALISKSSGEFVKISSLRKSKKLSTIRRNFKAFFSCDRTFTFRFIQEDTVNEIIKILKA